MIELAGAIVLFAGCLAMTLAHFLMEPVRWIYSYLPANFARQGRAGIRDALFCTALATYILPFKLGIPLRIVLLRRNGELTLHFLGVVIALDGLISLCTWSVSTAACIWLAALSWTPPWYVWTVVVVAAASCLVAIVVLRNLRLRWLARLRDALVMLDQPWKRIARSTVILFLDILSYGVRHALILLLITRDPKTMLEGGAIGIVATFAGIVSGLPMGLVGYDATLIALLALVGVRPEQALEVALLNRALNMGSAALLGIPAAIRLGLGSSVGSVIKRFREIGHGKV
jgi:uncharacterized membrane protein YbhN (UPF0104 family)